METFKFMETAEMNTNVYIIQRGLFIDNNPIPTKVTFWKIDRKNENKINLSRKDVIEIFKITDSSNLRNQIWKMLSLNIKDANLSEE